MTQDNVPLLDASVRLDALPATGRTLSVAANADQRAAIAERLNILSVERVTAELLARPIKGGIEVSGTLLADVSQECVVSFEPVPEKIEEKLFRLFLSGPPEGSEPTPGQEVFVDLEGEDLPDYFDGPEVDFTEWLLESLALSLDPYPRKPGVAIGSEYTDEGDEESSPFAALKGLKDTKD